MKHKATIALVCGMLLCALAGCQLALSEPVNTSEDRLAGILVTAEYLDLFDFEGYLSDNLNGISDGVIIIDGNTEGYQGRIYATLMKNTLTDEETGEQLETEEYVFKDVEGITCFFSIISDPERGDSYTASVSEPEISDSKMSVHVGDESNSTTMEGTIYVSSNAQNRAYYFNPVYQSADGSVYLTSGSGISASNSASGEGEQFSQTIDSTYTINENGKIKTETVSVKLSISFMLAPEKIIVLQMDTNSALISHTEFAPGELPQAFAPEPRAEYLIVETHKRNGEGTAAISRAIYDRDSEFIESFSARDDGICIKRLTRIEWQ